MRLRRWPCGDLSAPAKSLHWNRCQRPNQPYSIILCCVKGTCLGNRCYHSGCHSISMDSVNFMGKQPALISKHQSRREGFHCPLCGKQIRPKFHHLSIHHLSRFKRHVMDRHFAPVRFVCPDPSCGLNFGGWTPHKLMFEWSTVDRPNTMVHCCGRTVSLMHPVSPTPRNEISSKISENYRALKATPYLW